jgi:cyclopropane-fatty-acyl-phospholipid synthase
MIDAARLRSAGTSLAAIAQHYDVSDDFFSFWLGADLVYSCALWDDDDDTDTLERAQCRKLDLFAERLSVAGSHLLDVGCGWGAAIDRYVSAHHAESAVGLTLSPAQHAHARARSVPHARFALQSWVDHEPTQPYDVITAIESTEHLASDVLEADEKVEVYRAFFERLSSWLSEGGRVGLQLICLDGVGQAGSRGGRGPLSELIRTEIFPASMPSSLSEMVLGWETHFELEEFLEHTAHYRRTFRAWATAYRAQHDRAATLVGEDRARSFARYLAAGELMFRTREQALYRVILRKRDVPKRWAVPLWPSMFSDPEAVVVRDDGASSAAVRYHYDLSNDFYRVVLGPTMSYSSGLWTSDGMPDLDAAQLRKIDFFARAIGVGPGDRVLDVGCGWGAVLRRFADRYQVGDAVGITLSAAQTEYIAQHPRPSVDVRLEGWADHEPRALYDAIVSFGAFEHFARDGTAGPSRVETYRRFFARCAQWLTADGRLGLETIAHDGAPDTATPLGRGPLGDAVLEFFPESICPHLSEIVLGFEPWFEVEMLRADGADFARTFRGWQLRLRAGQAAATELVGEDTVRRFRRYLASSEMQFRTRTLSNYRIVLRRRHALKR